MAFLDAPWLDFGVSPVGKIFEDFDRNPEQRGNGECLPPDMTVAGWAWFPTL